MPDGSGGGGDEGRHRPHGWVAVTAEGVDEHLPPEVRARAEARLAEARERRGRLLARVEIDVYEHGEVPWVAFGEGALLGPTSSAGEIAAAVTRAAERLRRWR